MPYNYNGGLTIHATTATGAIPIQDALIVIKGSDEENAHIELSLITDEDGVTDTVYLPAPELSYSLDKSSIQNPYALYSIEIIAEGYYTKRIANVPVFPNTVSILPITMIPVVPHSEGGRIPIGNINTII